MPQIDIKLPKPYSLQAEILASPAKRKVLAVGRRGGKTTLAGIAGVQRMLQGHRVLLTSTTQDQADIFWRYVKRWLAPLIHTGYIKKNENIRTLEFRDGNLRVKTGSNADALRGDNVNLLIVDEAAYLDPRAWDEVGAPMLADTNGDAWFISTPKRRNHFFRWFSAGLQNDGLWQSWHAPSHQNPYLTASALEILKMDMSDEAYRQEILAEFIEGQGAVFRKVAQACRLEQREPYAGNFVIGVDWAQQNDYTVLIVLDVDTRQVVAMDRFNKIGWALQRGRLKALYDAWRPNAIIAESNSIGSVNIEALQHDGLPVIGFTTTQQSKSKIIESLVLALERQEIGLLDNAIMRSELEAYERVVSERTGRSTYSAPAGMHDDIVMALAIAWSAVNQGGPIELIMM